MKVRDIVWIICNYVGSIVLTTVFSILLVFDILALPSKNSTIGFVLLGVGLGLSFICIILSILFHILTLQIGRDKI